MKYVLINIFLLLSLFSFCQVPVAGRVTDSANNQPVAGATIQVDGVAVGVTDKDGLFTVTCKDGITISVLFIGFEPFFHKVKSCGESMNFNLVVTRTTTNTVEITDTSNPNKDLLYVPASIVKLGETELKRGTGLYMDDAINLNVPGVMMERRTISAGQHFNIRGYGNGARGTNGINSNFDGQGYKVYLNGIPLTDAEGITLMDDIDFATIGYVEVVKGPSGTLYGFAIAGVVNLKTATPERGKISIGQDVLLGSYGQQRLTSRIMIAVERASLIVTYGNQLYNGFAPHTASHKDFVNLFGEFRPNNKQVISAYVGYSDSYDERNGELTKLQFDTLNFSGNPAYINNNAHSNVISFRAGIGHTYRFNSHISNTTSFFGTGVSSNVSSAGGWTDKLPLNYGLRSTVDMNYDLNVKFGLSGIIGAELQQQNAQTMGYNMVRDSSNLSNYNIIGSMRSNQYTISKTNSVFTEWTLSMPKDISLTTGVGISSMQIELNDRFYVATNNNPSNPNGTHLPTRYRAGYNNLVSPHVALNKVFSKQLSAYASYSVGYKAPVSSYFFIPLSGQVNTGLKPEMGTQIEIGTKGTLLKEKLFYHIAVFDAIFSDKMTVIAVPNAENTATSYTYVANGGTQNNQGLEALVKYTAYESENGLIKGVMPFVNMTYSNFKYEDFTFEKLSADKTSTISTDFSGNTVAGVPPITVNAGIDFYTHVGIYANVNYLYRDGMYYTSDELYKTSSYNLVNGKIGFRRDLGTHWNVDAYFGANNITGTKYYYMVFLNQLPDAYLPAPNEINYFGGLNLKYIF